MYFNLQALHLHIFFRLCCRQLQWSLIKFDLQAAAVAWLLRRRFPLCSSKGCDEHFYHFYIYYLKMSFLEEPGVSSTRHPLTFRRMCPKLSYSEKHSSKSRVLLTLFALSPNLISAKLVVKFYGNTFWLIWSNLPWHTQMWPGFWIFEETAPRTSSRSPG